MDKDFKYKEQEEQIIVYKSDEESTYAVDKDNTKGRE